MSNKSGTSEQIISLPKGGGAMRGIGEKFSPDLHTGTGNFTVPIALPPGRNGFQPQLNLVYSTGNGNGFFGIGWGLSIPGVSRKTSKGVPRYYDYDPNDKPDVFVLSGAEDLVPISNPVAGITRYRPRTEGLFAHIDHHYSGNDDYWQVWSKDGLISVYGTPGNRGNSDPAAIAEDARTKFAWKLTSTQDPFGNKIIYTYGADEGADKEHTWKQPRLEKIEYAFFDDPNGERPLVVVIFGYETRLDPFSDYRAGFEIRTTQRCMSISVETHFDQTRPVRTYKFAYDYASSNRVSLLQQVDVIGYDDQGNPYDGSTPQHEKQLPPLTFSYSIFDPIHAEHRDLIPITGQDQPPAALGNPNYELVDLTGDGLPDVLEMNGTVRFWRNLGEGRFDLPRPMRDAPPFALADSGVQMLDANGDGRADLMVTNGQVAGYYPLNFDGAWDRDSFQRYREAPSFNLEDPEVKLVDLDGDGITDVVRSGSRLEYFFNDPDRHKAWTCTQWVERKALEDFPNVNFSDPRVKWGDMTGDGLQDIVLVYDGNVEYWPNLGHGNWGKRIHMQNSPRFRDYGYTFGYDPRRILIGDVDGDGCADIVYVDDRKVVLWINRSGNSWSHRIEICGTPPVTDMDSVRLVDFLGSGIAGVLWSADANINGRPHMYFLDFTGGIKPYVMNEMDNHMGATTRVQYAPSTKFYLDDAKKPATRWTTPLPFPVQVVERVEVIDAISRGKLTTQYRYHHGYWDGAEREFRGFGMVEQIDTETFDEYQQAGLHGNVHFVPVAERHFSPPTLTKTWFHQGPVGEEFGDWTELNRSPEYWQGDPRLLNHTGRVNDFLNHYSDRGTGNLPSPRNRRIKRDALRALRGSILRSELYALDRVKNQDAVGPEDRPYTVTEHAYNLIEISPPPAGKEERLRIFFPHVVAQRTTQWERGDDPMTQHAFTGSYDEYGRPHSQIAIAVPRGRAYWEPTPAGSPAPEKYLATHTLTDYAQRDDDRYIVDRVTRTTTYDIPNDGGDDLFSLKSKIESKALDVPSNIIGQTLSFYDRDPSKRDNGAFLGLPFGQIGDYGALVRTESLVQTDVILQAAYGSDQPPYLGHSGGVVWSADYPKAFQTALPPLAGYTYESGGAGSVHAAGYFVTTERRRYDFHDDVETAQGLLKTTRDPLGNDNKIAYEAPYNLLPNEVTNAVGLTTKAKYNYRVLQPQAVTDPNGNQTRFTFTPLGLLKDTRVLGKTTSEGDQQRPSVKMEYNFLAFANSRQPISVRTIRQVHHDTETGLLPSELNEIIEMREFSDGFGRLLQTRTQAEDFVFADDSFLPNIDLTFGNTILPFNQPASGGVVVGHSVADPVAKPRVVVSGWQMYDNKGRVVEKYEPFFDISWDYDPPEDSQFGQKATMFYDPRGQVIRTLNPDGSEQRVIYGVPTDLTDPKQFTPTPWEAYTYDANDNAGRTHAGDPRATLCQHHWNTPANILIDALGRTIETVERNRRRLSNGSWSDLEEYHTRSTYDIRGNVLTITDALGRVAFQYEYDLANHALQILSIDAGTRHSVFDAAGNLIERRDSKQALELSSYDALNRPTRLWARDKPGQAVTVRQRLIYGDEQPNITRLRRAQALERNLLGRLYRHYDEAGLLQMNRYDFKGNVVDKLRRVIRDASIANRWVADWDARGSANALEPTDRAYQTSSSFDALNRPKEITYPRDVKGHRAILKPIYNRAGTLEKVELDGATYVERIAYNAKGQRVLIAYGNNVMTRYAYDPQTFRLARLRTEKATINGLQYQPGGPVRQDFAYEYDLAGNITRITDRAPNSGVRNSPDGCDALVRRFAYDPLYRLVEATGRQSARLAAPCTDYDPRRKGYDWSGNAPSSSPENACDVTELYTERYSYDPAGNMLSQNRTGSATCYFGMSGFTPQQWQGKVDDFLVGSAPDWGTRGNRLTNFGGRTARQTHHFDNNGNLTQENSERFYTWDHGDRMIEFRNQATPTCQASVEARYLYDASGMRVKKWVRTNGTGDGESTTYIDGVFEHHRWRKTGQSGETNYLHVMDNQSRVALKRVGNVHPDDKGPDVQYHLGDHLGSSSVVVGGQTAADNALINREEYHPYGETSFGSFGKKRYRFTGRERDEESGLNYHGARYFAPWLARWVSCDPMGSLEHLNQYLYATNRATTKIDSTGYASSDPPASGSQSSATPTNAHTPANIKVNNATGVNLELQWKAYFESLPEVEKVIPHNRLKDSVTKKGIGSGKGTGPKDLAVIWKGTQEATIVEVSTPEEFTKAETNPTHRKAYQRAHTEETLKREGGAVVGNKTEGYFKATARWEAKGSPSGSAVYEIPGRPEAALHLRVSIAPQASPSALVRSSEPVPTKAAAGRVSGACGMRAAFSGAGAAAKQAVGVGALYFSVVKGESPDYYESAYPGMMRDSNTWLVNWAIQRHIDMPQPPNIGGEEVPYFRWYKEQELRVCLPMCGWREWP